MISISISSYNQAEWLPEAIESALNQTVPCEVIVVDDGSTDNSLSVAEAYQERIKIISQVNKGLSSARNTGLMNASGQFILFLDADDILLPNCAEEITKIIKEHHADDVRYDGKCDVISPSFRAFGRTTGDVILMPNPTIEDFKIANRVGYCSAIKTSLLKEVGGYSPRMFAGYEDLHLWFDLLRKDKKIITIPEVLWLYRTKEKSMWHDALKHHEALMAQIRKDFPEITNIINDPLPQNG